MLSSFILLPSHLLLVINLQLLFNWSLHWAVGATLWHSGCLGIARSSYVYSFWSPRKRHFSVPECCFLHCHLREIGSATDWNLFISGSYFKMVVSQLVNILNCQKCFLFDYYFCWPMHVKDVLWIQKTNPCNNQNFLMLFSKHHDIWVLMRIGQVCMDHLTIPCLWLSGRCSCVLMAVQTWRTFWCFYTHWHEGHLLGMWEVSCP